VTLAGKVRAWFRLGPTETALLDVFEERQRQETIWPGQTLAGPSMTDVERLAIVAEEFGEVAHDAVDATWPTTGYRPAPADLRRELVQLAACCVAWVEAIDEAER
jgi:hypothetical protein